MQSKSLALIFLFIIALPIIAISTSHELFFAIASVAVFICAARYILRGSSSDISEDVLGDEELEEELEELINIDIEKFSMGISIVYNMLAILYLFYCAIYVNTVPFKALVSVAVLFQVYFIIKKTSKPSRKPAHSRYTIPGLLSSLLNIVIIVITVIHKLYVRG